MGPKQRPKKVHLALVITTLVLLAIALFIAHPASAQQDLFESVEVRVDGATSHSERIGCTSTPTIVVNMAYPPPWTISADINVYRYIDESTPRKLINQWSFFPREGDMTATFDGDGLWDSGIPGLTGGLWYTFEIKDSDHSFTLKESPPIVVKGWCGNDPIFTEVAVADGTLPADPQINCQDSDLRVTWTMTKALPYTSVSETGHDGIIRVWGFDQQWNFVSYYYQYIASLDPNNNGSGGFADIQLPYFDLGEPIYILFTIYTELSNFPQQLFTGSTTYRKGPDASCGFDLSFNSPVCLQQLELVYKGDPNVLEPNMMLDIILSHPRTIVGTVPVDHNQLPNLVIPIWKYPIRPGDQWELELKRRDGTVANVSTFDQPPMFPCDYEYHCVTPTGNLKCVELSPDVVVSGWEEHGWTIPDLSCIDKTQEATGFPPPSACVTISPTGEAEPFVNDDQVDIDPCQILHQEPPMPTAIKLGPCTTLCSATCGDMTCSSSVGDLGHVLQYDESLCDPLACPCYDLVEIGGATAPFCLADFKLSYPGPDKGGDYYFEIVVDDTGNVVGRVEVVHLDLPELVIPNWHYPGAHTFSITLYDGSVEPRTKISSYTTTPIPTPCQYEYYCPLGPGDDYSTAKPCGTFDANHLNGQSTELDNHWTLTPPLNSLRCLTNSTVVQRITATPNHPTCFVLNGSDKAEPHHDDPNLANPVAACDLAGQTIPNPIEFELGICNVQCGDHCGPSTCSSPIDQDATAILQYPEAQCPCPCQDLLPVDNFNAPNCLEDFKLTYPRPLSEGDYHIDITSDHTGDVVGHVVVTDPAIIAIPAWKYHGESFTITLYDFQPVPYVIIATYQTMAMSSPCQYRYLCRRDEFQDHTYPFACGAFDTNHLSGKSNELDHYWTLSSSPDPVECRTDGISQIITATPIDPLCFVIGPDGGGVLYVDDDDITAPNCDPIDLPVPIDFLIGGDCEAKCDDCSKMSCKATIDGIAGQFFQLDQTQCHCPDCLFFPVGATTPKCAEPFSLSYTGPAGTGPYRIDIMVPKDAQSFTILGSIPVSQLHKIDIPHWIYPGADTFTIFLVDEVGNIDGQAHTVIAELVTQPIATPCKYGYYCNDSAAPSYTVACGTFNPADIGNDKSNQDKLWTIQTNDGTKPTCHDDNSTPLIISPNSPSCHAIGSDGFHALYDNATGDPEAPTKVTPCQNEEIPLPQPITNLAMDKCTHHCDECLAIRCDATIGNGSFTFPPEQCKCPNCDEEGSGGEVPDPVIDEITLSSPEVTTKGNSNGDVFVTVNLTTQGQIDPTAYRIDWTYAKPDTTQPTANQTWIPIVDFVVAPDAKSGTWTLNERDHPVLHFGAFTKSWNEVNNVEQVQVFLRASIINPDPTKSIAYTITDVPLTIRRSCHGHPTLYRGLNESCQDDKNDLKSLKCATNDTIPDPQLPCGMSVACNAKDSPRCEHFGFYPVDPTASDGCGEECLCPIHWSGNPTCSECAECPADRGTLGADCGCECKDGYFDGPAGPCSHCQTQAQIVITRPSPSLLTAASPDPSPHHIEDFDIASHYFTQFLSTLLAFPEKRIVVNHNDTVYDPVADTATVIARFKGLCDISTIQPASYGSHDKHQQLSSTITTLDIDPSVFRIDNTNYPLSQVKENLGEITVQNIPPTSFFRYYALTPDSDIYPDTKSSILPPDTNPIPIPPDTKPKDSGGVNILLFVLPIVVALILLLLILLIIFCICRRGTREEERQPKEGDAAQPDHLELR